MTLYTGITKDLERRVSAHNNGKGAKYCRGRTPVRAVWSTSVATQSIALKTEAYIKKLTKKKKLQVIAGTLSITGFGRLRRLC